MANNRTNKKENHLVFLKAIKIIWPQSTIIELIKKFIRIKNNFVYNPVGKNSDGIIKTNQDPYLKNRSNLYNSSK